MPESNSEPRTRSVDPKDAPTGANVSVRMARAHAHHRTRRFHRSSMLLVVALLLAAPGCTSSKTAEAGGKPVAQREPTTVKVENRSFLDNNVYVLRSGQRIRLGTVIGNSTATFTIPNNLIFGISSLQFIVDPIGGSRQPVSNEIRVSEGDEVRLVIPPS